MAIQKAIQKSGILSPWRNPLDPGDRFYRRVLTRAIMNFNGTQYATLSEPVVLDDFEIEVIAGAYQHNGIYFAEDYDYTNDNNRIGINGSGELVLKFDGNFANLGATSSIMSGKVSTYVIKRLTGALEFFMDGVSVKTATVNSTFYVQQLLKNWEGPVFSLRIWKDGDRNTGELVTDLRFDEPDSIYQRDYAVPLGDELVDFSLVPVTALEFEVFGDTLSKTSEGAEIGFVCEVEAGKKYKVRYFKESHEAGSPNFRDEFDNQLAFPIMAIADDSEEYYEFTFEAIASGRAGFNGNLSMFSISKLSIREWSGAILENTLPGDWEEISKKSGDDFWLSTRNDFIPSAINPSWTDNDDGSYTKNVDSYGWLGEPYIDVGLYLVKYSMPIEYGNMGIYTRNENDEFNIVYNIDDGYGVGVDIYVTSRGLWFDSNNSSGTTVSNISFRRKLQYAEGAL